MICKSVFDGNLVDLIDKIPTTMHKDTDQPRFYETIEAEREVLTDHIVTILGFIVPGKNPPPLPLHKYAEMALQRKVKTYEPKVTVINSACNRCNQTKYFITDACQGCVARPCIVNCPKKAITRVDGYARIDEKLCVACGLCEKNCPYGAVIKKKIPCVEGCPVDAIDKTNEGYSIINNDKCLHCGRCSIRCPFNAIVMPSMVVDVVKHLTHGSRIYAMLAPATMAQFNCSVDQLYNAVLALGFTDVIEVALGADTTSITEAGEFVEHIGGGKQPLLTTSCCPAFVRAVKQHIPGLVPYVSTTKSPMGYAGDLMRDYDRRLQMNAQMLQQQQGAKGGVMLNTPSYNVFIGPCSAKRREILYHENTDYALTAEELLCMFNAKGIEVNKMNPTRTSITSRLPSSESTHYCVTQGVTLAVVHAVPKSIDRLKMLQMQGRTTANIALITSDNNRVELKPIFVSPLDKTSFKQLQTWGQDVSSCPGNLIECMCCEGGCVGGAGNIVSPQTANTRLKKLLPQRPNYRDIEDVLSLK